jgi:hypothetical protein
VPVLKLAHRDRLKVNLRAVHTVLWGARASGRNAASLSERREAINLINALLNLGPNTHAEF